jgi:hypothetical protein
MFKVECMSVYVCVDKMCLQYYMQCFIGSLYLTFGAYLVHDPSILYTICRRVFAKISLTFICPCIINIIPNYYQQDATFLDLFISIDALYVSGGSSAHNQEHTTVHTASGIVNQYCC